MSDIRQKIHDDIEDYYELCEFFKVEPNGQIDYSHYRELKIKMDEYNKNKT